ncbi:alpha/beta hydrolase [Roseomonas sp. HF4]|uniref:alpha/beta hydrolase n=1 Tax=Roseomonas sp. HF4 TaxID=2562313 RepID=UPI0010C04450|nr:alpha/beta hydrolase [Roseomonas sp. HF4]
MKGSRRALLAALALPGCSAARLAEALTPTEGYVVRRDLAYGPLPRHRFDLYLPEGMRPDAPLVTFLHGGSWRSGSKDVYRFLGEAFASRGAATAVPNYRLFPEVRFPAFVEDAALAMAFLGGAPGLPGGRRVLAGHSAGAHIAMLATLDPRYRAGSGAAMPDAVVGIAGPYDFLPLRPGGFLASVFGGPDRRETQPITYADRPGPPMLLLHGLEDRIVLPEQSERMAARRRAAGFRAEVITYGSVGHIDIIGSLAAPIRPVAPRVLGDIMDFVAAPGR